MTGSIDNLILKAETGAQWATICKVEADAIALAAKHGAARNDITEINVTDGGELASIGLGSDEYGMGRFVLNFAL